MKFLLPIIFLISGLTAQAQQLYLECFGSYNRTKYTCPTPAKILCNTAKYLGFGGRIAGGTDHYQLGAEVRSNLSNPEFSVQGRDTVMAFDESYLGAFVRTKISRYPSMRFGLVLRAGAGFYRSNAQLEINKTKTSKNYGSILGYNAGLGVSIPAYNRTMLELGYTFNYLKRPNGLAEIPGHRAAYHMFSVGLSLNFVFGKLAKKYERTRKSWKYHRGWQNEPNG